MNQYDFPLQIEPSGDRTCPSNLHQKLCFVKGIPCKEVRKEDCVDYILAKQKLDASRNASYQEKGGI